MAERIVNGYQRLFEIRLLHHYWLDEGATVFDRMEVMVRQADVLNYTALTLRPQKVYEIYHQPEGQIYRYKENVPVLSNLTGVARITDSSKALFLSKEIPALANDDQVEALVLSGSALAQLTSDQPGASTQILHDPATAFPVFVHQGDVPAIAPPDGLVGVPARGVRLSSEITDEVFALIRLSAVRADDGDFSLIDSSGHAKTTHPVFHIRFKNRSTIWQYRNKRTRLVEGTEPNPLPLTYFGNAGTKPKPSAGLVKAVKSGTRTTQLVSDVFV